MVIRLFLPRVLATRGTRPGRAWINAELAPAPAVGEEERPGRLSCRLEEHGRIAVLFELRQYRMRPGKKDAWVKLMEEEVIPFQTQHGMVIVGSWVGEKEDDLYVWLRRFDSEEERVRLYEAVYQSDHWKNEIGPRVGELIDREKIVVTRLSPTAHSVIR
jgi:hypothetical protein